MKFCSFCGSGVELRVPEGDNLPRYICGQCETIHYQNPKIVTGCIAEWEDKILLCKRAIEPRAGNWTLPAGYMENRETTLQAAMRETQEEANADVEIKELYALFNIPHISQVYLIFRAALLNLDFKPGAESLDVKLFKEQEGGISRYRKRMPDGVFLLRYSKCCRRIEEQASEKSRRIKKSAITLACCAGMVGFRTHRDLHRSDFFSLH